MSARIFRFAMLSCSVFLAACGGGSGEGGSDGGGGGGGGFQVQQSNALNVFANASGLHRTRSTAPELLEGNPFFQALGSNGRACVTCHDPEVGWTITPAFVQQKFNAGAGTHPLFRTVDGANSPNADVSTLERRREAYSMLLNKGLIHIGRPIPANAEFTLVAVDDPYGFAGAQQLSLFRRPAPTTNLRFLATLMWDGREHFTESTTHTDFARQANQATRDHAESARDLTAEEAQQIVDFELSLVSGQISDNAAGGLGALGARGRPVHLETQEFFFGINDPLDLNPTGAAFDPRVFQLYDTWAALDDTAPENAARRAVARGQEIFNSKPIAIQGVKGLNDELNQPLIQGTCTLCHDTPNVGNHSAPAPLDLGLTDESRRTPDMPLYTLQCTATGQLIKTTDPGRALVTGKCKDIGRFKGPILRNLAARAPYFHNGFAANFEEVVRFYDTRFAIGLSAQEKADLIAFLRAL
jgi:cytochrome c peroxidase